jgi:hypothetical protein
MRGGEQVQRTQALGVGLLHQQRPPDVGMAKDAHPRRVRVIHLRQVATLDTGLRVLQCVEVTRRQR